MDHEHTFVEHVGIRVFANQATAWVPASQVDVDFGLVPGLDDMGQWDNRPVMQRCTVCGEQGFEVPA
jgi:hypothetical protein